MTLLELFRQSLAELKQRNLNFALAGGMVASLYRKQPRTTTDIDFLICSENDSGKIAKEIIETLGLKPNEARKAQLVGDPKFAILNKSTPIYIIVGRVPNSDIEPGLDFILPDMPWFKKALERAQYNQIDFGFGKIPCLTAEDIIISKFYSLGNDSNRTDDLSDIKSIFENKKNLDLAYISSRMRELELTLPMSFEKQAPLELKKTAKDIRREIRKKILKSKK